MKKIFKKIRLQLVVHWEKNLSQENKLSMKQLSKCGTHFQSYLIIDHKFVNLQKAESQKHKLLFIILKLAVNGKTDKIG